MHISLKIVPFKPALLNCLNETLKFLEKFLEQYLNNRIALPNRM